MAVENANIKATCKLLFLKAKLNAKTKDGNIAL